MITKSNITFIIHLFLKIVKIIFLRINEGNIQVKLNKNIFYLKYIFLYIYINHKNCKNILIILISLISKNEFK